MSIVFVYYIVYDIYLVYLFSCEGYIVYGFYCLVIILFIDYTVYDVYSRPMGCFHESMPFARELGSASCVASQSGAGVCASECNWRLLKLFFQ